ncbi:hypothetical protein T484DRAFT_2904222 [Baffinella frigidus]|nr:hypothetical protein T484DRAFT_2904222 [Cryptophyta sp. CCMP2293]|mmetsp:Transcript_25299/g.60459  ORF Transcript_25299/g.60459 Transcript_25299/m.60459 type:complete len:204 (-) Transcript_25299:256-867(-)
MAGAWKETANRGFYYGPKSNNAWNNDSGWKNCIKKENKLAAKFVEMQDPEGLALAGGDATSVKDERRSAKSGSHFSSASRDSLYRHFDKLGKEEQVQVLKDALGRKERLDKLESASQKFEDKTLRGLSGQQKAEKLLVVLGHEREKRTQKEALFVELLNEERAARVQAEASMKMLEGKLDNLAQAMGVGGPNQQYLRKTNKRV